MRGTYALMGLGLLTLLTGCNKQPSLVGQWTGELPGGVEKVAMDLTIQDAKWSGVIKTKEITTPMMTVPPLAFDVAGVWQNVDGGKITFSTTSVKAENPPPAIAAVESVLDNGLESSLNKYNQATVKFVDDKTATLTAPDSTVLTLTRKP